MDEHTLARFMGWVEIRPNGCWFWTGKKNEGGYGYFWLHRKSRLAHRVSHEHFTGPIPDAHEVDHLCHTRDTTCPGGRCDHRACVNPAHLEPVTEVENVLRSRGVAAANASKNACQNGHPLDEDNTYTYPNGERACRTCMASHRKVWASQHRPAGGPRNAVKTCCPQGHPYDEVNTRINSRGSRVCLQCVRTRDRESKRATRAARRRA